jgi:hypothetical protein
MAIFLSVASLGGFFDVWIKNLWSWVLWLTTRPRLLFLN